MVGSAGIGFPSLISSNIYCLRSGKKAVDGNGLILRMSKTFDKINLPGFALAAILEMGYQGGRTKTPQFSPLDQQEPALMRERLAEISDTS